MTTHPLGRTVEEVDANPDLRPDPLRQALPAIPCGPVGLGFPFFDHRTVAEMDLAEMERWK